MSNGTYTPPALTFDLMVAPFPEGFQGDMDETFQQFCTLVTGYVIGNFMAGAYLQPGSTLPTSDIGPVFMSGTWYAWNPTTNSYQPSGGSGSQGRNVVKNSSYQIAQIAPPFYAGVGQTLGFDLSATRAPQSGVLVINQDVGPPSALTNDLIPASAKYTVGPTLVPTPGATDFYGHEHMIEGSDLAVLQGQTLSLSFWFKATQSGTYSVYLTNSSRDHSYVATFTLTTVNVWTRMTILGIPPLPTSAGGTWNFGEGTTGLYIGWPLGMGAQWQTGILNTWQGGLFAGTAQNVNLLAVNNNQAWITGIKLEPGSACTYYSARPFEDEFNDAVRYYWTSYPYQQLSGGNWAFQVTAWGTNGVIVTFLFPRRMCASPSVTFYNTSNAGGSISNISTGANYPVAAFSGNPKGVYESPSGLTATKGDVFAAFAIADARLK